MSVYWYEARQKWIAQVKVGDSRESKACDTHDEAVSEEAQIRVRLDREQKALAKAAKSALAIRLAVAAYEYELHCKEVPPETLTRWRDTEKRLTEFLAAHQAEFPQQLDEDLARLVPKLFEFRRWRRHGKKKDEVKDSTINRDLHNVLAMIHLSMPSFHRPKDLLFPEEAVRVRWLEPDEVEAAKGKLKDGIPARVILLVMLTLMRLSEASELRREWVRLKEGIIEFPKSKRRGENIVTLNAEAIGLLESVLNSHDSDWVFPNPHGRPYSRVHISRLWRKVARAIGKRGFTVQDLRHHGAMQAYAQTRDLLAVKELGRWKRLTMVLRYTQAANHAKRTAAECVAHPTSLNPPIEQPRIAAAESRTNAGP
jgi:integrase